MSELTSIVGLVLVIVLFALWVWTDFRASVKAKREQDVLNETATKMYNQCVGLANASQTLKEVEESLLFMDKELHDKNKEENRSFKYPKRHSDFRACYAYLKGKRAILLKLEKEKNEHNS